MHSDTRGKGRDMTAAALRGFGAPIQSALRRELVLDAAPDCCMPEKHSHTVPGGRGWWWTERLWHEAEDLPVEKVEVSSVIELDMDCWFGERNTPTIRAVAEHTRRINDADLVHPIILASDGRLMDGGHRLAKAHLLGHTTINARRFQVDPDPDWVEPRVDS